MWAFLVLSYIMLMQLLGMIPLLGWFAAIVLIPAFSASFMIASRELDQGGKLRAGAAVLRIQIEPAGAAQAGRHLSSRAARHPRRCRRWSTAALLLQLMVLGKSRPRDGVRGRQPGRAALLAARALPAGAGRILVRAGAVGVAQPARRCRRCSTVFSPPAQLARVPRLRPRRWSLLSRDLQYRAVRARAAGARAARRQVAECVRCW